MSPRRAAAPRGSGQRISAIRRFNRAYTQRIGLMQDSFLGSGYTLAEVRVLYEVAHRRGPTASELAADLSLDAAYLSRILRRFEVGGLIRRERSADDARKSHLSLTPQGRAALAPLDRAASADVAAMLAPLAETEQERLVEAMRTIEEVLAGARAPAGRVALRAHRAGDLGWVVARHGAIYAEEQGWDERFEGYVAGIVAAFAARHDPRRERLWIAEQDGVRVGSVMLVAKSRDVAQLRLLLVEPRARGAGLGHRLVATCVRFARAAGYRRITLWTEAGLAAARRVYENAGFRLVETKTEPLYGARFVGQRWEMDL